MTDYFEELSAGVVRVDSRSDTGTGFVASADGLIVTCAHLFSDTDLGKIVDVVPHATGNPIEAIVIELKYSPDVAVLQIAEGTLPGGVQVLRLGSSPRNPERELRTFGYPKLRSKNGLHGELEFVGPTAEEDEEGIGYPQLVLHSDDATLGFSGAPIWDPEQHTVIGIIKSIATGDPGSRLRNTAIGVPVEVIKRVYPALRLEADTPYSSTEPSGVCFISSEYPPRMVGGLGSHVEQLTAALARFLDISIVLPQVQGMDDYEEPLSRRIQLSPLTIGTPSYQDPASWLEFGNYAADHVENMISDGVAVDVIHCHDWVTVLAGVKCRWRHNIPLIFHVHLPNRTPLCAAIEDVGLACADCVTVSSKSMRDEMQRRIRGLGMEPGKVKIVRNGVDLDIFKPRDDWPADDGYILFVGRLVAQKGVQHLIRAFYYVLQKYPDLQLKVVGKGELRSRIQRLCQNLMMSERQVCFVNSSEWVTRQDLASLYQGARVVLVPSIYEPLGMTALEALACKRPVVASNVGGLRETIRPNVNGFLAEPGDELDLAQWLMALLADQELRMRMGDAGRRGLRQSTWPEIALSVRRLYSELHKQAPLNAGIPPIAKDLQGQVRRVAEEVKPSSHNSWGSLFDWEPRP